VNVIFVCTGNTCRSPLAEALARKLAAERGLSGITFESAGTSAYEGAAASDGSVLVGLERGVDLSRHRARLLTSDLVREDTIILAMATSHLTAVNAIVPTAQAYLLDDFASRGKHRRSVADPFGGDLAGYREAADDIQAMLSDVLDRLMADRTSSGQ
jgi:protein-tyrosine-phosphatase